MRLIDANALHREISEWPESVMYKDWVQAAIANAQTITPPPNAPLTLDELREMEGEPVFLKRLGYCDRWALVKVSTETLNVYFILVDGIEDETFISAEIEIKNGCKVYRRKPEE